MAGNSVSIAIHVLTQPFHLCMCIVQTAQAVHVVQAAQNTMNNVKLQNRVEASKWQASVSPTLICQRLSKNWNHVIDFTAAVASEPSRHELVKAISAAQGGSMSSC